MKDVLGLDTKGVIFASAKQGIGTKEILEAVVNRVKPPTGDPDIPLQALIFDSGVGVYKDI